MMDLGEAIALATALLAARPRRTTPAIAEEAAELATACGRAKAVRASEAGLAESVDARPFDVAMDRAWATFVRRIEDHAELAKTRPTEPSTATKVHAIVHDLSILKLNYLAEFAQIGARLDALKREGLFTDARDLAGAVFLDEVLRCHAQYGTAIGATDAPADAPKAAVATGDRGAARLALVAAIREYVYQVLAIARSGRPDGWAAVQAALVPIADLNARQTRERSEGPRPAPRAPHPPVN